MQSQKPYFSLELIQIALLLMTQIKPLFHVFSDSK